MNVLIVGGAGNVGRILRPALEARYNCYHLDLQPVPGAESRTTVGSINDPDIVRAALQGMQAAVFLAMGVGQKTYIYDVDATFDVNAKGAYRFYTTALQTGVRRFVHASSLSVYEDLTLRREPRDESSPPNAWHVYGFTKRVGEMICETAALQYGDAGIVALRLMSPMDENSFKGNEYRPDAGWHAMGPNDTCRLFIAALEYTSKPGYLVVQATGDLGQRRWPYARAEQLLGWRPEGK